MGTDRYLDIDDEGATLGLTQKDATESHCRNPAPCPACKGYGGWHLKVDAYGPGKHFDCSCSNCWGWGWVERDSPDASCVHTFVTTANRGRCLNEWTCTKCGRTRLVDSSD